jgi:apolipoprotein N-acyltransferase
MKKNLLRSVASIAAGATAVLAFAPFYAWPIASLSLAVLFWQWTSATRARQAAFDGWLFAFGLLGAGVSWIYVSLHVYGGMPAILAGLATMLFCAVMALYLGFSGLLFHKIAARTKRPLFSLLLLAPTFFVIAELLRATVITGFPWLSFGYSHAPSGAFIGIAPVFGVFGVSWVVAFSAALLVLMLRNIKMPKSTAFRSAIGGWAVLLLILPLSKFIEYGQPDGAPVTIDLLQGNIDQKIKWNESELNRTMEIYRSMVLASRAKLIVLPETAVTSLLHDIPQDYLIELKNHAIANGGDVLLGVPIVQRAAAGDNSPFYNYLYNAVISLGASPTSGYSKQHLVAFGEFMPPAFSWAYQWLSIPLSNMSRGSTNQTPMALAAGKVAINICYEDAFGNEVAWQLPDAQLLVNVSNMAWYGKSLAADQHLQLSQMRSIETSRWMLRATNTGMTAAIDQTGKIIAALPQFTRSTLSVTAQPRSGTTPYVRWRDWPIIILCGLISLAGLGFAMRKKPV